MTKILIVALFVTASIGSHAQVHRPETSDAEQLGKASVDGLPIIDATPDVLNGLQAANSNGPRLKLYEEYSVQTIVRPDGSVGLGQTYVDRFSYDPFPSDAALVAVGHLSDVSTTVDPTGHFLYTRFSFTAKRILKSSGGEISNVSIQVVRFGGLVRLRNGKLFLSGIVGEGLPDTSHEYLLFLMPTGYPNLCYIETGYANSRGTAVALDRRGDKFEGRSFDSLVSNISRLAKQ